MSRLDWFLSLGIFLAITSPNAYSSDLSYTFLDFRAIKQDITASGSQTSVPNQIVTINVLDGEGIGISGTLEFGERFYIGGSFSSSIIGVTGLVSNPLGDISVEDTFDAVFSRFSFGYQRELSTNFDLVIEATAEFADYDFGSFTVENFDTTDSGAGARIGFRWNPVPALEVYTFGRFTPVGKLNLDTLEFDSDTLTNVGFYWYFFEDLGLGLDIELGEVETATLNMRFSFGNLPW